MKWLGRRWLLLGIILGLFVGASLAPVAAISRPQPEPPVTTVVAFRAAYHAEAKPRYDRVVFELDQQLPEHLRVEYVAQLIEDGSGLPVSVAGNRILQVTLSPTNAHTEQGKATISRRVRYTLPNVKEVVLVSDFEGTVSFGIGLTWKAEYRFFTETNPTRVVIDFLYR
jgi:hypothetical protein